MFKKCSIFLYIIKSDRGIKMGKIKNCPGADRLKGTPYILEIPCPACGYENEVFSNESEVKCEKCGETIKNTVKRSAVFKG